MKRLFNILMFAGFLGMTFYATSCKEDAENRPFTKKQQTMISEYLDAHAEYSLFKELADTAKVKVNYKDPRDIWVEDVRQIKDPITGKMKDTTYYVPDSVAGAIRFGNLLGSSGKYTLFVPNNKAMQAYLTSLGYTKVTQMSESQKAEFMKMHILKTQVAMRALITGPLPASDSTLNGVLHYIDADHGVDGITINKKALVINSYPKETFNGYIYEIDHVLTPHPNRLDGCLAAGDRFKIFLDAFKYAELADTILSKIYLPHRDSSQRAIGKVEHPFHTLLAVSDENLAKVNVTDVPSLLNYIKTTTDILKDTAWTNHYTTDKRLMQAYLLYHIVPGQFDWSKGGKMQFYGQTARMFTGLSRRISTALRDSFPYVKGYFITTKAGSQIDPKPVLNGGINMLYENSDLYAKNGFLHELDAPLVLTKNMNPVTSKIVIEPEDLFLVFQNYLGAEGTINHKSDQMFTKETFKEYPLDLRSNVNFSTSKPDFGSKSSGFSITYTPRTQNGWFEMVFRDLPASSTGKYKLRMNYKTGPNRATNVLVYWRPADSTFNSVTDRLKIDPLNLSDYKKRITWGTGKNEYYELPAWPVYKQDREVGVVNVPKRGDYVLRFLHVNKRSAEYDNFILEECE